MFRDCIESSCTRNNGDTYLPRDRYLPHYDKSDFVNAMYECLNYCINAGFSEGTLLLGVSTDHSVALLSA